MHRKDKGAPRPAPEGLEAHAKMVWDKVESCGWAVVYTSSKADAVGHAYTVGLFENFSHPEIMIAGQPQLASAVALNHLGLRVSRGENFEVCEPQNDVLEDRSVRFSAMHPAWSERLMALNELYTPLADLPAIQALWPDDAGVYPDEPGCDPSAFKRQPVCSTRPKLKPAGGRG